MFPLMVPTREGKEIGGPIPNGSVSLAPRIPTNFLSSSHPPYLHEGGPFPPNSHFSSFLPNNLQNQTQHFLGENTPLSNANQRSPSNFFFLPEPHLQRSLDTNRLLNLNKRDLDALLAAKLAEQFSKNHP